LNTFSIFSHEVWYHVSSVNTASINDCILFARHVLTLVTLPGQRCV
jgi:hypothetical protein